MSMTPEVATPTGSSTDKEILEDLRRNADLYFIFLIKALCSHIDKIPQSISRPLTWLPLDRTGLCLDLSKEGVTCILMLDVVA